MEEVRTLSGRHGGRAGGRASLGCWRRVCHSSQRQEVDGGDAVSHGGGEDTVEAAGRGWGAVRVSGAFFVVGGGLVVLVSSRQVDSWTCRVWKMRANAGQGRGEGGRFRSM